MGFRYDDETTYQQKIVYANKLGLGGLMIWAIDLDDGHLGSLRAISGSSSSGGKNMPFDLVDLDKLFPNELLPSSDAQSQYGLVNIGNSAGLGEMNPSKTGFGFFLLTDDSHAVTSLRRRQGEPEPFTFLDCLRELRSPPTDKSKIHTARVVCLHDDVAGCFRVLERGVEGTLVELPAGCAAGTVARAVSLQRAHDQYLPADVVRRGPTSEVYNFSFDFNVSLRRRDSNSTRVPIDFSSHRGYCDKLVDADGVQGSSGSRGGNSDKQRRYFGPDPHGWMDEYDDMMSVVAEEDSDSIDISGPMDRPLYR